MKKLFIVISLSFILALGNVALATEIFYGVRGSFGSSAPVDLITIDSVTGALDSVIELTGLTGGIGGLAISPINGTIYTAGGGDGIPGLHTLDPTTGVAILVDDKVTASDMDFDSSGTLYAVMADGGIGVRGELATIDLATGNITSIGGSFLYGIGLSFDSDDTLYIKETDKDKTVNYLHTVDKVNGSILNTVELDTISYNSLAIDENDTFYSHKREVDLDASRIVAIDPDTGITTALPSTIPDIYPSELVWPFGGISALAFAPAASVPEPATIFLVCAGLVCLVAFRRKST